MSEGVAPPWYLWTRSKELNLTDFHQIEQWAIDPWWNLLLFFFGMNKLPLVSLSYVRYVLGLLTTSHESSGSCHFHHSDHFMVFMSFLGCFVAVPHAFHWGPSERFSKAGNPRGTAVRNPDPSSRDLQQFSWFSFPPKWWVHGKKNKQRISLMCFLLHTFTYLEL